MPPSERQRPVLIAGCGDLGIRVGRLLLADGCEVVGLRRDPCGLPAGFRRVAADLADASRLAGLPAGSADVVYLAAADGFTDEAYRRAYVDGLRNLLAALPAPGRLLFASSTSVHAQSDGSWVDESSSTDDATWSRRRLLEGEALAREADGVVLRLAGIYGPGRTRLLDLVRRGDAGFSPEEDEWTNRIHADDAAEAIRRLLAHPSPEPVYLLVDDEPARRRDVLEWLARKLGAPPPRPAAGARAVRPRSSKRCSNRALRATGWRPRHPTWREGYEALIDGLS